MLVKRDLGSSNCRRLRQTRSIAMVVGGATNTGETSHGDVPPDNEEECRGERGRNSPMRVAEPSGSGPGGELSTPSFSPSLVIDAALKGEIVGLFNIKLLVQ